MVQLWSGQSKSVYGGRVTSISYSGSGWNPQIDSDFRRFMAPILNCSIRPTRWPASAARWVSRTSRKRGSAPISSGHRRRVHVCVSPSDAAGWSRPGCGAHRNRHAGLQARHQPIHGPPANPARVLKHLEQSADTKRRLGMSDLWVRRLRERLGFRDQPPGVPETGRWKDNVVARRWRSRKHEDIYLNGERDGLAAQDGISLGREFSPGRRLHQTLGYRTHGRSGLQERRQRRLGT